MKTRRGKGRFGLKLETLFHEIAYTGTLPEGEAALVTQDSRRVCPGAVFVCAKGLTSDGHDYARAALEAGAACVVTERPLGLARWRTGARRTRGCVKITLAVPPSGCALSL